MDERTFKTLEVESLVVLLARHVQTPLGRRRALSLIPSTDRDHLNRELDITSECVRYFATTSAFGLGEVTDPESVFAQLQIEGTLLDPQQILALQTLISAGLELRSEFANAEKRLEYPNMSAIASGVPDLRRMIASVRGKILPTGEVDDNASPELRRIRRDLNERRARIYRSLESLMRDRAGAAIQEEFVTLRNGRFVIPVKTDSRGQVPGVMHGLSSSGQTTYVEPMSIIDQNNDMVRLREEEEIEINRILRSITEAFRSNLPAINQTAAAIAEIDFAQSKARLSAEFNCVRPMMTGDRVLNLSEARHLMLEHTLRQVGGRIVPISLEMDENHQTMVVSGPNAGGKTVVVKTVGLVALMAQMGLHVPAKEATLPVFDQVLADIGDQQSIAANLSTFTAHMRNIAEMTEQVSPPSLILIDEVGTGTDPDEGAALGVAVVDYFRRRGATTIATTHYNPLKIWASQQEDVLNASVEFDEKTLRPTYRLLVGIAGASSGIEIARRMNVPPEILSEATSRVDPEHIRASDYLKQLKSMVDEQQGLRDALEEERQATAQKYATLDIEFARLEAERRREFEAQLANVIRDFNAESSSMIASLQDRVTAARLKKETDARTAELKRLAGVRLRKHDAGADQPSVALKPSSFDHQPLPVAAPVFEPSQLLDDTATIEVRDRVLIKSLNKEGTVESVGDGQYTVLVGSLKLRATRDEIQPLKKPKEGPAQAVSKREISGAAADAVFTSEINVIGSTADEATDRVDKFLDEAFLAGADSIRVVHGHGKGTLRRAISELLTGHPHVEGFGQAPQKEGGAGAMIVALRK